MSELAAVLRAFSGRSKTGKSNFPTVVMKINYPIHRGKPNPCHGKFFFAGCLPAGCYDPETTNSLKYDTEQLAIGAAAFHGADRIQGVDCRHIVGEERDAAEQAYRDFIAAGNVPYAYRGD